MRTLEPDDVIAVDLDGTLADSTVISLTDYRPDLIGEPIKLMVGRVKEWLAQGRRVVIFTARVHPMHGLADVSLSEKAIKEWCLKHIGVELEVTCMKDPMFHEIWDDRVVRVVRNEGKISCQSEVTDVLVKGDSIGGFFD